MIKKLGYLVVGVIVAAQFTAGAPDVLAQPKTDASKAADKKPEDPVIKKALRDLDAVAKDLDKSKEGYGGHREKALELVKEAHRELMMSLQFAAGREKMKEGAFDINNTSSAKLQALPGINEETAKKIHAGAPYTRKDDLVKRKILTQEQFDKIRDEIRVGPAAKK